MSALTGSILLKEAVDLAGVDYTNYLSPGAQADLWFEKAMLEVEERLFRGIQDQRTKDELYGFTISNFQIPIINAATNSLNLGPSVAVNITFQNNFPIVGTVTYTVTTLIPHNIPIGGGSFIYISAAAGLTYLSAHLGVYAITVTGPNTFTFAIVTTEAGTYTANTGMFYWVNNTTDAPLQLIDYFHFLNAIATYSKPILPDPEWGISTLITGASNTDPIVIGFFTFNNLRTGDQIVLAGFTSNTNANGTFYIQKISKLKFALYTDKLLQNPVAGNGAFNPADTPTISRIYVKSCKPYMPDEQISQLSNPSEESPRFKESGNQLIFYPQPTSKLLSLSCDYLRLPFNLLNTTEPYTSYPYKYIDTTDNTLDMNAYYHRRFLERLPEAVIDLIARESANNALLEVDDVLQQKNP